MQLEDAQARACGDDLQHGVEIDEAGPALGGELESSGARDGELLQTQGVVPDEDKRVGGPGVTAADRRRKIKQ